MVFFLTESQIFTENSPPPQKKNQKTTSFPFEWEIFNIVVVCIGTSDVSCVYSPVLNDFRQFRKLMKYENTQMSFLESAPVPEMST